MQANRLLKSAGTLGGLTFVSRVLGLVRDMLIAFFLGTNGLGSAFVVAFTIPNLFRRLFGEGALFASFIPIFIEVRENKGSASAWRLAQRVGTLLSLILILITIISLIVVTILIQFQNLTPLGEITLSITRIMLPYLIFICVSAFAMGLLNACNHFIIPALSPILLNLCLIATMTLIFPKIICQPKQIYFLAWSVVFAGILQLSIHIPMLLKKGANFKPLSFHNDPNVRRILILMGPATLGIAVTQFNVLIDRLIAIWIGDWAPAALFFSERMIYLPLGLIATALGTVLLPTFSEQVAKENKQALSETLIKSINHMLYIMVPATIGLLWFSVPIIKTLFEWNGEFNSESTKLCARALMFYAPGLIIFSANKLIVPAIYALKDTRTPVLISIRVVIINFILNLLSLWFLPEYWKHAGMAFSTVLSEGFGMIMLFRHLNKYIPPINSIALLKNALYHLIKAIIMVIIGSLIFNLLSNISSFSEKFSQIYSLGITIILSIIIYAFLSKSNPEQIEIIKAVSKKPR